MAPSVLADPDRKRRIRTYALACAAFYVLAIAVVLLKPVFDFAVSDGRYYYVYLPSLVLDGDLHFEDEIEERWGPDFSPELLADVTSAGYVRNKYPVGMALTLAPAFLVAHGTSLALHAVSGSERVAPDGYSLAYQLIGLAWVLALGLLTFVLIDVLLVDHLGCDPRSTWLAIGLYWGGSHYAYYYFREPLMAHVVSTFWVAACLWACATRRVFWIALCASMALVTRPTNALVILPFLVPAVARREFWSAWPRALVGLVPIAAQMAVWRVMHGSYVAYSYGSEGFDVRSPELQATLVSSKHGLLFWSPLLLFSFLGLFLRCELRPWAGRVTLQLALGFVLLWYANSAWHQWWFGDAFGGRAFLELTPLFVFGLARTLDASRTWRPGTRRAVFAALALCFAYSWALMALYITHRIPRADYLF